MYSAQDEAMTKRYQNAYIEKCRKVKAIEMANNECRLLQHDIHCLLDTLVELVPAYEILNCPYWSDSEDDDEYLFLHRRDRFFPDNGSEPEVNSEEEELSRLQAEYDALLKASEKPRHLGSPSQSHHSSAPKVRRVFKHLPVNEAGEVEFPVTLGRGPNRISISKIGPIIQVDEDGVMLPLPTDYECRRKFADFQHDSEAEGNKKDIYYICSILAEGDNSPPIYSISVTGRDFSLQDSSLPALWTAFCSKFPETVQTIIAEEFSGPRIFFGLEHDNLQKYFKDCLSNTQTS